jgi:hypothetical protein
MASNETLPMKGTAMELAALVLIIFLVCIVAMILATPLLIISRLARMVKKSYAKLFSKTA